MDWNAVASWLAISISIAVFVDVRLARASGDKNLEKDEQRKKRVDIVLQLLGARYVLCSDYRPSSEEVRIFNTAISLFPIYFADDKDSVAAFDSFMVAKSDENLIKLLRAAGKASGLQLLDSQVQRVLTVNAAVPVVFTLPAVIQPDLQTSKKVA